MKKTFLSLKPETIEAIKKRAAILYGGNRSLCARLLIEKGLEEVNRQENWEAKTK